MITKCIGSDVKVCTYCRKKNHAMILNYIGQKLFRINNFIIGNELVYFLAFECNELDRK